MQEIDYRFTIYFGNKDANLALALNKLSLNEERSKNQLTKMALKKYLIEKGYLDEGGEI